MEMMFSSLCYRQLPRISADIGSSASPPFVAIVGFSAGLGVRMEEKISSTINEKETENMRERDIKSKGSTHFQVGLLLI